MARGGQQRPGRVRAVPRARGRKGAGVPRGYSLPVKKHRRIRPAVLVFYVVAASACAASIIWPRAAGERTWMRADIIVFPFIAPIAFAVILGDRTLDGSTEFWGGVRRPRCLRRAQAGDADGRSVTARERGGAGEEHSDPAVLDPARGAGVLRPHPSGRCEADAASTGQGRQQARGSLRSSGCTCTWSTGQQRGPGGSACPGPGAVGTAPRPSSAVDVRRPGRWRPGRNHVGVGYPVLQHLVNVTIFLVCLPLCAAMTRST